VKNKLARPFYEKLVEAIKADNEQALKAWEDLFPEQYVVLLNGVEMKFRPDKKHLEQELKDIRL
jgi:hypothetical protein